MVVEVWYGCILQEHKPVSSSLEKCLCDKSYVLLSVDSDGSRSYLMVNAGDGMFMYDMHVYEKDDILCLVTEL